MIRATHKRPAPSTRVLIATIVGSAVALSGCASPPTAGASGSASATPHNSATPAGAGTVAGTGPTEFPGVEFAIPGEARSVVVDFECAGGGTFSVELGDSMMLGQAPIEGTCDGTSQLSWPITERTGSTLHVLVPDGVDWVAAPAFSTEEFAYDVALEADCARFSDVYSAFTNADSGYTEYQAFDAAEWTSRVDRATADLEALVSSSESELSGAFAELEVIVTDPDRRVGASVLNVATQNLVREISQACNANQTPFIITAEFGG